MEHHKFLLALVLLLFTFFAKILIGKSYSDVNWLDHFIELPLNLFFLSISLLCAYTLTSSDGEIKNDGLIAIVGSLLFSFPVVTIWRIVKDLFSTKVKILLASFLLLVNFLISTAALVHSANLLLERDNNKKAKSAEPINSTVQKKTKKLCQ